MSKDREPQTNIPHITDYIRGSDETNSIAQKLVNSGRPVNVYGLDTKGTIDILASGMPCVRVDLQDPKYSGGEEINTPLLLADIALSLGGNPIFIDEHAGSEALMRGIGRAVEKLPTPPTIIIENYGLDDKGNLVGALPQNIGLIVTSQTPIRDEGVLQYETKGITLSDLLRYARKGVAMPPKNHEDVIAYSAGSPTLAAELLESQGQRRGNSIATEGYREAAHKMLGLPDGASYSLRIAVYKCAVAGGGTPHTLVATPGSDEQVVFEAAAHRMRGYSRTASRLQQIARYSLA